MCSLFEILVVVCLQLPRPSFGLQADDPTPVLPLEPPLPRPGICRHGDPLREVPLHTSTTLTHLNFYIFHPKFLLSFSFLEHYSSLLSNINPCSIDPFILASLSPPFSSLHAGSVSRTCRTTRSPAPPPPLPPPHPFQPFQRRFPHSLT